MGIAASPTLICVVGPAAVRKNVVARELALRTGFALFPDASCVDIASALFLPGSPGHDSLVRRLQVAVVEQAAASHVPGLVLPLAWAFDEPRDARLVESFRRTYRASSGRVLFIELEPPPAERANRYNTNGVFDDREDWLRLDVSALTPEQAANAVRQHFSLPIATR